MKVSKKTLKITILILVVIGIVNMGVYKLFFSLANLPKGDLIKQVPSPSGEYIFNAYLVSGNATVDFAIRGELVFNKEYRKPKTIYWNYHESEANVIWIDNQTVEINGHTLNVLKDRYDWRRHLK